jgi:hypothetical protein
MWSACRSTRPSPDRPHDKGLERVPLVDGLEVAVLGGVEVGEALLLLRRVIVACDDRTAVRPYR